MNGLALVTGAAGFIGSYVVRQLLDEGYSVVGIGHAGRRPSNSLAFRWHESEIDVPSLRNIACVPDLIVHCAGSASVASSIADPEAERRRTVDSAVAVLEFAASTAPAARLVLISSAAVYGHVAVQPISEERMLEPVSPYGEYKQEVEAMWCTQASTAGLHGAIVRLFSVYGEGLRKQLLWDACMKFSAGDAQFSGTGEESRDWLHVADAARLLVLAGRHASPACPVVNGGAGQTIPVREVLAELSRALGTDLPPCFNGVARPGDPMRYWADVSRARHWGWNSSLDWREGVRRYAHWFRHGAL